MIATPFLTFYIAGLIFSSELLILIKFVLLGCLYAAAHTVGKTMFDDYLMSLLPLSVYMATKLWFYVTWFGYIAPVVSTITTILFSLSSGLLWYCFLNAWRGDPGIIKPTQEQRFRVCNLNKFISNISIYFRLNYNLLQFSFYRQLLNYQNVVVVDLNLLYSVPVAWCVDQFDLNIVRYVIDV